MVSYWRFLLHCWIMLFVRNSNGADVFVNINLDFVSTVDRSLRIYNDNLGVENCTYLRSRNNSVELILNRNLKTSICSSNNVTFYIFTYYSNIRPAVITIKTRNRNLMQVREDLKKNSDKIVILNFNTEYVNYIKCANSFVSCQFESVDQNAEKIPSETLYSACPSIDIETECITDLIFHSKFIDASNENENIGSLIMVEKFSTKPKCETSVSCLNGGIYNASRCICPKKIGSIEPGPRCEVLQQQLWKKQNIYCLPNTKSLLIEFSLFSIGYNSPMEIFKIKDKKGQIFLQYNIMIHNHSITTLAGNVMSLIYPFDIQNEWIDISIQVFRGRLYWKINEKMSNYEIIKEEYDLMMLDTLPLILRDDLGDSDNTNKPIQICLSNLRVNSRLVDLFTPSYLSCASDGCLSCAQNQSCFFTPLKAGGNAQCVCKTGLRSLSGVCEQDTSYTGQFGNSTPISIPFSSTNPNVFFFQFRTLMPFGDLVKLSSKNYEIVIAISNGLLQAVHYNMSTKSNQTVNISCLHVSDGEWHLIQLHLKPHLLRLILIDNNVYSKTMYYNEMVNKTDFSFSSVSVGTERHLTSNISYLICYENLIWISYNDLFLNGIYNTISLKDKLPEGCDKGINCTTLKCPENNKCIERWQNTSCVCAENFADVSGTCSFVPCLQNPCKNNGDCHPNDSKDKYKCRCTAGYTGYDCEFQLRAASILWWHILIIVLLLLIIIIVLLIVVCIKCRRKKSTNKSEYPFYIEKVYENTVSYNNQAGEEDYNGPPINMDILIRGVTEKPQKIYYDVSVPSHDIKPDLEKRKVYFDSHNEDLKLDAPLEYAFEGYHEDFDDRDSYGHSVFSI